MNRNRLNASKMHTLREYAREIAELAVCLYTILLCTTIRLKINRIKFRRIRLKINRIKISAYG